MRVEPGREHALNHQHAFGDHQPLARRQVGTAIDTVQVPEVVEPRVIGILDVLDVAGIGAHGLSSTSANIKSAALRRMSRCSVSSVDSRLASHS